MNNNSDPLYKQYADLDFSDAKPIAEIPALAQLQAEQGGKSRITMCEDNDTLSDLVRETLRKELDSQS